MPSFILYQDNYVILVRLWFFFFFIFNFNDFFVRVQKLIVSYSNSKNFVAPNNHYCMKFSTGGAEVRRCRRNRLTSGDHDFWKIFLTDEFWFNHKIKKISWSHSMVKKSSRNHINIIKPFVLTDKLVKINYLMEFYWEKLVLNFTFYSNFVIYTW